MAQAMKKLKLGKAVGLDNISGEMLRCSLPTLIDIYTKLFNAIFNMSCYPDPWRKGIIVNLYKAGDPFSPDNYQGLTLNSCIGKVFSTNLNERLSIFLQKQ